MKINQEDIFKTFFTNCYFLIWQFLFLVSFCSLTIEKFSAFSRKNPALLEVTFFMNKREEKKSARFAGTFSSRAARSGIFERRASRSVLSGPRASRLVLCSSHTFKFISYILILKLKPIL